MQIRCAKCMKLFESEYEVCPFCGHINEKGSEESLFLKSGTKVRDRYIIGEVLGYGGFGATYVGWDEMLEQKVAIKEYFPSELSTRKPGQSGLSVFGGEKGEYFGIGLKKYLGEARTMAKLENIPNIVGVKEYFEENNTAYIVMEFVEGVTLKEHILSKGVLSPVEAVRYFLPLIKSLGRVHSANIIHRDISPDNVMINNTGVKLIDFGAAREVIKNDEKSLSIVLKHGYAPAEQYRKNGNQGPWTDVYAMCATIYKSITGVTPPPVFERMADDELVPPSKMGISIAPAIEKAILKGMDVKIENRIGSMDALYRALSESDGTVAFFDSVDAGEVIPKSSSRKNVESENPGAMASDNPFGNRRKLATDGEPISIRIDDVPVTSKEKKGNKAKWIIIVLVALLIVAGVVIGITAYRNYGGGNNVPVDEGFVDQNDYYYDDGYDYDDSYYEETSIDESSTEPSSTEESSTEGTTITTSKPFTAPDADKNGFVNTDYDDKGDIVGITIRIWGKYEEYENPYGTIMVYANTHRCYSEYDGYVLGVYTEEYIETAMAFDLSDNSCYTEKQITIYPEDADFPSEDNDSFTKPVSIGYDFKEDYVDITLNFPVNVLNQPCEDNDCSEENTSISVVVQEDTFTTPDGGVNPYWQMSKYFSAK